MSSVSGNWGEIFISVLEIIIIIIINNHRAKALSLMVWLYLSILNTLLWNQVPYFLGLVMLSLLCGRNFDAS